MKELHPVQHPVIPGQAIPETILQALILGGLTALSWWLGGFEVSVLVVLVLGFSLNTLNLIAATMSQNVHLAEIRDLLLERLKK